MAYFPVYIIFIPILFAVLIYMFKKQRYITYLAFVAQTAITVLAILYFLFLRENPTENMIVFGGWDQRIGIALMNDMLSMAYVFLSIFLWWVILIYLHERKKHSSKFLFFLLFLEGVFLGLIQTNDLFNLFVFIELTTILATILIAFQKTGKAFRASLYYLLLNTSGVLFFLIGVIMLYNVFGTMNMTFIADNMHLVRDETIVKFAFILMLAGVSVKSAIFPVFTWLPRAHGVARSGISALLSGLIVKGGVYLFIRVTTLFGYDNFSVLFFYIGAITAIVGFTFALSQKDMKQILAYHTISQVGIIVMGLSALYEPAVFGGFLHIFNHAFFKSLLFLGAGVIIRGYKKKEVTYIRGAFRSMPIASILMIVGMLGITGAPMFNGYISKAIIKYATQEHLFHTILFYLINLGTAASFVKMAQIFFGPKQEILQPARKNELIAMGLLAIACLSFGIFHVQIAQFLFTEDVGYIKVFTFNGFFQYALTLAAGYVVYRIVSKDFLVIRKIRQMNLSFESANYIFLVYIFVLALYFVI